MGFLSGLFSDKKKVDSKSNQTGEQSYGLSDEAKNYWSQVAPTFQQNWTPVANDPNQTAAAGAQAGLSSGLNPAFNTATGIGQTGISTADIQRFQNPWEDQVVQNTLDDMRYADSKALTQSNASAAKMGALGGSGGIVRRNLAEEGFQDARNKAITGIRQQGFNTAADLAGKSTQAQLAGLGAASGIAGQQSGINQTQFGMGTQGWNQAWQNANQPYTTAAQGAQVLAGLSPASGQSTSGTSQGTQTTTATPSLFSVGANLLGTAFAGGWQPFSDARVKENIVPIGESFDGQPIYKFSYKGDPRTVIGLMAQDVEEHTPEAVGEIDGIKTVDYDVALEGAERGRGERPMADGGAVGGGSHGRKDPHAKFKSAFEAISGLMERARGGSISGMAPARAAGGPIGSWSTTATPASTFDNKAFGAGLQKLGQSQSDSGSDDTSLLQQRQQSLSSMLSGMQRRPYGGAVWGENGPEFGGSSGMEPTRVGATPLPYRSDDRVTRRELPLRQGQGRSGSSYPLMSDGELDQIITRQRGDGRLLSPPPLARDLDMTQPRSVRTFNPGAMNAGRFAQSRGAVGSDGRLAVFPDEATGYKAMSDLLDIYGRRGQNTIATIIGGLPEKPNLAWAPRGVDNNSTDAYIKKVATTLGIDPNAPLLPEHREPLMRAMAAYESGSGGGGGAGGGSARPVRVAEATTLSSSGAPVATDAPKRSGWFSDGIWAGEKMTPMQRLGVGLMSVRGPMFGGPMNDMAKQLMGMEEGRLREKQIDNQADQFAKQIAQAAAIARGEVDGAPTLQRQQFDSDATLRQAQIAKLEAEAKKLNAQENDPISGFIAERLKSLSKPSAATPAQPEPKDPLLHKRSFEGDEAPRATPAVAPGEGGASVVPTQAVVGDGPVASRAVEIPGTTMIDTPLGKMPLNEARQLGGAMLVSPKHQALGRAFMDAIERTEKTMTKDASASNLSQSAMSEVNKKEISASEGLSRLSEIDRLYDPKYQTWEEGLKNAGLAAWDSIGLFRDKMTEDQRKSLTDFTKFKSTAVAALNDYVKEITGAAMSIGEAERIRKAIIDSERDSPTQFKAKLDQGMRLAQLALIRHSYTRKSGKPWSESGISLDQMERIVESRTNALRDEVRKTRPNAEANEINAEVSTKLKQEFGI